MTNLMSVFPPDLLSSLFSYLTGLGRVLLGSPTYLFQQTKTSYLLEEEVLEKGLNKYYGCMSQDNMTNSFPPTASKILQQNKGTEIDINT